jgi:hypothetical protein
MIHNAKLITFPIPLTSITDNFWPQNNKKPPGVAPGHPNQWAQRLNRVFKVDVDYMAAGMVGNMDVSGFSEFRTGAQAHSRGKRPETAIYMLKIAGIWG